MVRVNDCFVLLFQRNKLFLLEASLPQKHNDKARLVSIVQQPDSARCLEFWYHMFGSGIGKLNIYANMNVSNNSTRTLLWSRGANVGDVWRKAHISTEFSLPYRIIFEGVVGSNLDVSCRKVLFLFTRFSRSLLG